MNTAFLFPGHGAQAIGMGKEIYEKYEIARKIYDKVEEITIKKLQLLDTEARDMHML